MSKKIILFLSGIGSNATECEYICPDGTTVTGSQTNEAPVKYLLKSYSDISELLCIVTPQAEETAWERFQATVKETSSTAKCVKIRFAEDAEIEDILPEVLAHTDAGDEILLETTGGFRNAVMYLLLISRALSYARIKTLCAVYSNLNKGKIEDVSHMLQAFDLIGGMQDMTSFGSVRSLRSYYSNRPHDTKIDDLLDAVYRLWECITLCRPAQLSDCMSDFNSAMEATADCDDPLMKALLPAFRKKFGRKKLATPSLIRWCVESDMLQQALTIYRERIPLYVILDKKEFLAVKDTAPAFDETSKYNRFETREENEADYQFNSLFLKMARISQYYDSSEDSNAEAAIDTIKNMGSLLARPNCAFIAKCSVEQLRKIAMDYQYIRCLRNMTNHASDQALESQQQLVDYLVAQGYPPLDNITAEDIRGVLLNALDNLKPQPKKPTNGKGKKKHKKEK